jgi:hypothetical protein
MTRAQQRRTNVFCGAFSCLASSRLRSQLRYVAPDAAPPSCIGTFATAGEAISCEMWPKYPALILLQEQLNNSFVITLLQIIGLKVARNHTLAKQVGGRAHLACQTAARSSASPDISCERNSESSSVRQRIRPHLELHELARGSFAFRPDLAGQKKLGLSPELGRTLCEFLES